MRTDPGFLRLRKIRAAQKIARTIASSASNKVYLPSGGLMLNIADETYLDVLDDKKEKRSR
jgi:prohibitin 2